MTRFVNLNFRLVEYGGDENHPTKEIVFGGHRGWQSIQFFKDKPTPRELELLTRLSVILDEMGTAPDPSPNKEEPTLK